MADRYKAESSTDTEAQIKKALETPIVPAVVATAAPVVDDPATPETPADAVPVTDADPGDEDIVDETDTPAPAASATAPAPVRKRTSNTALVKELADIKAKIAALTPAVPVTGPPPASTRAVTAVAANDPVLTDIETRRAALGAKPVKPTRESVDFDDARYDAAVDAYDEARDAWRDAHADLNAEARHYRAFAARAQAEQVSKFQAAVQTREESARAAFDDYDAVMVVARELPVPAHVKDFLLQSEMNVRIAYSLGKDRAEYDRIMALPPMKAIVALGKLEDALSAEAPPAGETTVTPTGTPKRISLAPNPPSHPLGGGGSPKPTTLETAAAASQQEYNLLRRKQQADRHGRGLTH